ncbi:hypothetical protein BBH56_07695 [Spiribacter roseus]|nr:hypothetical protein BBH56_07695 [Spiribacter roseus]
MPSGVRLLRTHPELDYDALEREIDRRLNRSVGVGQPDAGPPSITQSAAKPSLLRGVVSRLVATRFMREELAAYPRLYRGVRRLYHAVRKSQ